MSKNGGLGMASLLLTHGYLVTVNPSRDVIRDGWIRIDDDRINAIGAMVDLDKSPPQDGIEIIDLAGMVVVPGFINGHNHHWGSLFKNTGEGLLLELWLDQVTLPLMSQLGIEDLRVAAYLSAIEQIHTGTTCSLNHVVNVNDAETMEAIIAPVLDVGIRQLVTKELRQTPQPPFSTLYDARPHVRPLKDELALAEEIIGKWDGAGGLIHMGLAIETGANWMLHNATSDEMIIQGVDLAKRRNLKITNHCSAGTPWLSIKEFQDATGGGDVDYLVRLGALVENWVLIHSLHLKDREIEHVARAGASIITNPVSNAYSCDGIAPVKSMFRHGVNVGLGTDGTYVNCSCDMVQQMKFAALIQNVSHFDPTLISAERAIEMATINTAKALGIDHLVGSIEVGKKADLAIFDFNKAHVTVPNRPVGALVFTANGTDVDTVIVNGKVRLRGGKLVGFTGESDVLKEATARATEIIHRAGLAERVFVDWNHRR
jgi:5-methylthioadenosine/S-adenosylhomocysteine deaminase